MYETLNEMLEDDIMAGLMMPMTVSQKKMNKREAAALIVWYKYSVALWKEENERVIQQYNANI